MKTKELEEWIARTNEGYIFSFDMTCLIPGRLLDRVDCTIIQVSFLTGNDRMVIIIANTNREENIKSGCVLDGKEASQTKAKVDLGMFHIYDGTEGILYVTIGHSCLQN